MSNITSERLIYVIISEDNEVECAFSSKLLAETYKESLEEQSNNKTWRIEETYCYPKPIA